MVPPAGGRIFTVTSAARPEPTLRTAIATVTTPPAGGSSAAGPSTSISVAKISI